MMHYGFCRKHADQTGEGGCPECAMDHQQNEIITLRAKLQAADTRIAELEAERDQFKARSFQLEGCLNPEYIPPWLDPESMVALLGEGEW